MKNVVNRFFVAINFAAPVVAATALFACSNPNPNTSPYPSPISPSTQQSPPETDIRFTCGDETAGGKAYRWCIEAPARDQQQPRDVIYFFHGNGGSERSFWENPSYRTLRARWTGRAKPAVISFSFGPSWYLGESRGPAGAIAAAFPEREIFPQLEAKLAFKPRQRIVFGESQGGFNATQIFLRHPAGVARVALACPALPGVNPRATDTAIQAFVQTQPGAEKVTARDWYRKIADRFPTDEEWQAHDPFRLVTQLPAHAPELLVICGSLDPYGFFGPAKSFAALVQARGIPAQFRAVPNGRHCAENESSLAALAFFLETGLFEQIKSN